MPLRKHLWIVGLCAAIFATGLLWMARSRADTASEWENMLALVRRKFPDVPQLEVTKLAAWLEDKARPQPQLLDVREENEFRVSHLKGAVRVSPDAKVAEIAPMLDPKRPVVLYCSVGYRSSQLAKRLQEAGWVDIWNLEGAIFAWANKDLPLVTPDGKPTTLVHPYSSRYSQLVKPEHHAPP